MRQLRLGVVGCGYWGRKVLACLPRLRDTDVAWCCDVDPAALEAAALLAPRASFTRDPRQIPADEIDAALILTPAATHFELATHFLESGRDLFVEKPLGLSRLQVETIGRLVEKQRTVLASGHQYLFHPSFGDLVEEVATGRIGPVLSLESERAHKGMVKSDVHAVWDLAPHDISMVRLVSGELPSEVQALGFSLEGAGRVDAARIVLRHQSGLVARIFVSWSHEQRLRRFSATGSCGVASMDEVNYPGCVSVDMREPAGQLQLLTSLPGDPLEIELRHFVDCIWTRSRPRVGWRECREVIAVLEAIDRSLEAGGSPVSLELPAMVPVTAS